MTLVKAFGEEKSIKEWAEDERCLISEGALYQRIMYLKQDPEIAITFPVGVRKISIRGEVKTVLQWFHDPRCKVSLLKLLTAVIEQDQRILSGSFADVYFAFNEWKTLRSWSKDERCRVSLSALLYRVLSLNWEIKRALITPPGNATLYSVFGEEKTLNDWVKDFRCRVSSSTIRVRLKKGFSFEEAVLTPPRVFHSVLYSAFGEEKRLSEWAKDSRCLVTICTAESRMKRGYSFEKAITLKKYEKPYLFVQHPSETREVPTHRDGVPVFYPARSRGRAPLYDSYGLFNYSYRRSVPKSYEEEINTTEFTVQIFGTREKAGLTLGNGIRYLP